MKIGTFAEGAVSPRYTRIASGASGRRAIGQRREKGPRELLPLTLHFGIRFGGPLFGHALVGRREAFLGAVEESLSRLLVQQLGESSSRWSKPPPSGRTPERSVASRVVVTSISFEKVLGSVACWPTGTEGEQIRARHARHRLALR